MAINTFPSSPMYQSNRPLKYRHPTLETDEFSSGGDLDRILIRFPKRILSLKYIMSITDRDTIQNFLINNAGKVFWFVDTASKSKKKWVDEYVGRGGPLTMLGALASDNSVYTNDTIAANAATANGMTLLPAAPVANQDAYFFGGLAPFDKITLTIGTQGAGTWTITWKYWNGAWTALTGVSDGSTAFKAAAGARDITFNIPDDWVIYEINGINAYWVKADLTAYTGITTQPKGSGATINSKTYELHGVSTSSVTIYEDGVAKTGGGTDYSLVSGGGAASADRITWSVAHGYSTQGALITSDFTGNLRIKAKTSLSNVTETDIGFGAVSMELDLREVQW